MELFKYLKKRDFEALLESGSIRLGTLKNYQSSEHGTMVSDSMEGAKRFTGNYSNVTADSIKGSHALSSLISIGEGGGIGSLVMDNVVISEPNYLIFSMSSNYSDSDHKSWLDHESYDSCYKIIAPSTFFRRVTQKLNKLMPVKFLGLFEVHYYDEEIGMDFFDDKNSYPAFMLKNHDGFSTQKEIRAVWEPTTKEDITPINLNEQRLRSYVNFYRSLEIST